jgi:Uma2 family endonuclease
MAAMTVMPRGPGEWTVHDLDALPDDGLQYELLDGMLLVTPAPLPLHQLVLKRLYDVLNNACPEDLAVLFAPLDWRPDHRTSLQPDLLVLRKQDWSDRALTTSLLLAVEVLSPSTKRKDRLLKASAYADGGIPNYWLIDPDHASIHLLTLSRGGYLPAGSAVGDQALRIEQPFELTLMPADLLRW